MPRLHFIANGLFSDAIAGGDIHFFRMASAAIAAGHRLNFFGGHALQRQLQELYPSYELVLTDRRQMPRINATALKGQSRLFFDYFQRFISTMRQLREIRPEDAVYAVSDYWFDVLPAVRCAARRKLMILHMQAPSLGQVINRSRPDVDSLRLASTHYWMSQNASIGAFRRCRNKRLFYVHPSMRPGLLRRGYQPQELKYSSFGVDTELANKIGPQPKTYDVVWIGRVHRQKGIDDLMATLNYLNHRIPDFRAVLIGNLKKELGPLVEQHRLQTCVEFSGFVTEEEKFRLFRSSRLFLMTSRFEGSPRVIAESLVCHVPVVAYDVANYRPLFGEFARYVPCFDVEAFQREAERQVLLMREEKNYLNGLNLEEFCRQNSWETNQRVFLETLGELKA